jgi:hypothetical protein
MDLLLEMGKEHWGCDSHFGMTRGIAKSDIKSSAKAVGGSEVMVYATGGTVYIWQSKNVRRN